MSILPDRDSFEFHREFLRLKIKNEDARRNKIMLGHAKRQRQRGRISEDLFNYISSLILEKQARDF